MMISKIRRSRPWLASLPAVALLGGAPVAVVSPLTSLAGAAEDAMVPTPVALKGIVVAKGSMSPLRYNVQGAGHLIADAPKFELTTSVPISQLTSAKPVVTLASPKGEISLKITQEISIKDKTVVPYIIIGGTGAYKRPAGSGRIRIELISRSGLSGTVKLTFVGPAPASATAPASK